MKILITGGAGYIGSITAARLATEGHSCVIYDNLSTGFREAVPTSMRFILGDVRDPNLLARVFKDEKIEAVLHFAAKLIVPESLEKPLEYYDVNASGTLRLIQAAVAARVKAFIFSSTAAVYGNPARQPVPEDEPLHPLNPYGASKAMAERFLQDAEAAHGLKSVSLRYFNVAGASLDGLQGQRMTNATHLLKVAAETACGRRPSAQIFGTDYPTKDGTGVRDFIHVEDLVQAHVLSLNYLLEGGTTQILNCGYGHGFSVREVYDMMRKVHGADFVVTESARRPGDPGSVIAQNGKIKQLLLWDPRFDDLETLCRSTLEWERGR